MSTVSEQTRRNRVTGARKAAATRKLRRELGAFLTDGTPIAGAGERGTERGDYSPSEILARIRDAGPRPSPGSEAGGG